MILYTEDELIALLGETRIGLGRALLERAPTFVPDVRYSTGVISALLRSVGSPTPIRVYLRVRRKPGGGLELHEECSCRRRGCSHVAAVLLQVLEQTLTSDTPTGATTAPKPDLERQLIYRIGPAGLDAFAVTPQVATRGKSGYSVIGLYVPRRGGGPLPGFIGAADRTLLERLAPFRTGHDASPYEVQGRQAATLLESLVKSGRCLLQDGSEPLRWDEPIALAFEWDCDEQGNQRPTYSCTREVIWLRLADDLRYLDAVAGSCGEMRSPLSPELRAWMAKSKRIKPQEVAKTQAWLEKHFPKAGLPPLRLWTVRKLPKSRATPCLTLIRWETAELLPEAGGAAPAALLAFDYEGHRLDRLGVDRRAEGETLFEISRDPRGETACQRLLMDQGLIPVAERAGQRDIYLANRGQDWRVFQVKTLPILEEQGWRVEVAADFPFRLARTGALNAQLKHDGGDEWFGLSLGVEVEGEAIDLAPLLLGILRESPEAFGPKGLSRHNDDEVLLLRLDDGRHIGFTLARLRPILEVLYELFQGGGVANDGAIRLDRFRALRLGELHGVDNIRWLGDLEPLQLLERLRGVQEIPAAPLPDGFQATLRGYQQQGLNWLQFLRAHNLAGVLADDMGLGKTVQTLAHLLLEKQQGGAVRPSLVIAPTSLMGNWRREARQFAPALKVLTLHGPERQRSFRDIGHSDLVLTTYPLLVRDAAVLKKQSWHLLILDEAQVIKNPKAKAGQLVRELKAAHRLCLTGTPMENHLGELWSLFDFLLPGFLGNADEFRRLFRKPIEQQGESETAARLARRVRPFLLRRTKEAVVAELPPKTEIIRSVELEGAQRDLYETIRNAVQLRVRDEVARKGLARSSIIILDALLKLRQVCCDPRLVKLEQARKASHSAKLEMLMELLPEMLDEGRRILLFSQFTEMLALIEEAVTKAKIPYVKLTGQSRDRTTPVDRFQRGEVPLFLISLKAGGVGLNLTAADTVIHYDPWWNPAAERQATDRAHRIGQDKPVFVYKLITEGTVEERIHALQQRKQALADSLLDRQGDAAPQWNETDLEMLFEPLG